MQEIMDNDLKTFYDACTDMGKAKFILADAKISKILKSIVDSSELIAVVGEALVNFNFDTEFSKAQVKNDMTPLYFNSPKEKSKIVALVFGLLSEFDAHRLDLHTFINDYYGGSQGKLIVECYEEFVNNVILPFRDAMCTLLGIDFGGDEMKIELEDADLESARMVGSIEKNDEAFENVSDGNLIDDFFTDITNILSKIQETISYDHKIKDDRRDELNITIEAIMQSIELGNLKIMNALMISLNYLLQPVKSVKFYNMELQNRLLTFYDDIQA